MAPSLDLESRGDTGDRKNYSGDCAAPSAKQKKSVWKFKVERVRARCSMLFYVHVHMQMAQSLIY